MIFILFYSLFYNSKISTYMYLSFVPQILFYRIILMIISYAHDWCTSNLGRTLTGLIHIFHLHLHSFHYQFVYTCDYVFGYKFLGAECLGRGVAWSLPNSTPPAPSAMPDTSSRTFPAFSLIVTQENELCKLFPLAFLWLLTILSLVYFWFAFPFLGIAFKYFLTFISILR